MRDGDLLEEEVKVLVTLLDALDAAEALPPDLHVTWRQSRTPWDTHVGPTSGVFIYELLSRLEAAGGIKEGWVLQRWLKLRTRIENRLRGQGR